MASNLPQHFCFTAGALGVKLDSFWPYDAERNGTVHLCIKGEVGPLAIPFAKASLNPISITKECSWMEA